MFSIFGGKKAHLNELIWYDTYLSVQLTKANKQAKPPMCTEAFYHIMVLILTYRIGFEHKYFLLYFMLKF